MERKEWENLVKIEKDDAMYWRASDEVNSDYGTTPSEAVENLWNFNLRKWKREDREMYEEMKLDEQLRIN